MTDTDLLFNFITYMNMTIVDDKLIHIQLIILWTYCMLYPGSRTLFSFPSVDLLRPESWTKHYVNTAEPYFFLSPSKRNENKALLAGYSNCMYVSIKYTSLKNFMLALIFIIRMHKLFSLNLKQLLLQRAMEFRHRIMLCRNVRTEVL
jgi:hypothetical protein